MTAVGAEYIIMEKAPGVKLAHVWPNLAGNQRSQIVKQIVHFEKRFTASPFAGIGSLYYAESLDDSVHPIPINVGQVNTAFSSEEFVIGPTTDPRFSEEGRSDVESDRGPCTFVVFSYLSTQLMFLLGTCIEDYLVALGLHDIGYVRSGKPFPPPGIFGGPGWYQPSIAGKISALEDYVKIARNLPPKDPLVTAAVLWHDDLHSGNIFVDPDDPTHIICIIDWQSSHISPLFRHIIRPDILNFEGSKPLLGMVGDARKPPELPSNFQDLPHEEQKAAEALARHQSLYKIYEIYSAMKNPSVSEALLHQQTLRCQLINYAAITGYHTEPFVKARLIEVSDAWERIVGPEGPSCPLHYSEHERKTSTEELGQWADCCALLDSVLDSLGAPAGWDGAVSCEQYLEMREKLQIVREEFLDYMANDNKERAQWVKAWPYDDDEDVKE